MARATIHELVNRINVSRPPRFMLSVCREASNTVGLCSRSDMKLPNSIAKMTASAPMNTQTPSTPGRRLGSARSAGPTCVRLTVDTPRSFVLSLQPPDRLDDEEGQAGDPEEPGEKRDPEADHAVEGQRPGGDERDCTDNEE